MALPLVLAGPIVRKVDAQSVTIWIALSEPGWVRVKVWEGDQTSTGPGTVQSGAAPAAEDVGTLARKWGEHLYTATATASSSGLGSLTNGRVYSYDVVHEGVGLQGLGLLEDSSGAVDGIDAAAPPRLALGYLTDRLPTFVTPAPLIPGLRLAHTSCRKPHGLGPDALAWMDDVIEGNRLNIDKRPQQLFLTGDQIYADDVAGSLLAMLQPIAAELLGFAEDIPMSGGAAGSNAARTPLTGLPPLRRGRLCAEVAKFTSTDCASHLLGFGEFAAMYLAVWSPRVWRAVPARADLFTDVAPADRESRHLTDFEAHHGSRAKWDAADLALEKVGGGTGPERDRIEAFKLTVAKVARVLANSATYMVFDDHEITDDWYISAPWRTRVLASPMGRSVLRNGLMAYAVFQAPGNDPDRWRAGAFDPASGKLNSEVVLHDEIVALLAEGVASTRPQEDKVDALIGLTSPMNTPDTEPRARFHYTVDGPRHRVVVLDTRTWRTYDSATRHSPPKLVGTSLDKMLPAGPLADGREMLIVVSAAPVLFPRIFDALVQPAAAAVFDLRAHMVRGEAFNPADPKPSLVGSEEWDVEGWGADETAFHALIRRLGSYPSVVVLGGDVHFASSLVCDVWNKGDDVADSRIMQCVSSASHNEPPPGMRAVLRAQRSAQHLLQGKAVERLGWDGDHGIVLASGAHIQPGRRARLRQSPTYVPAAGWPAGTTIASAKPPDVRYRVAVLRDERPAFELGIDAPHLPTLPAWNPADPIATYADVATAHQQLVTNSKDPIRLMVFRSNIGLVSFAPSGMANGYTATHAVMSPVGDGTTGADFTHHVVDMALTAAATGPAFAIGG
ncbi:MAG: hypothetical protein JWN61_1121 [Pseudonocardiales bacterium]|nr:hypothetical protein [Pseudonocardiales bacterium]